MQVSNFGCTYPNLVAFYWRVCLYIFIYFRDTGDLACICSFVRNGAMPTLGNSISYFSLKMETKILVQVLFTLFTE